jgi:hypothetical protein
MPEAKDPLCKSAFLGVAKFWPFCAVLGMDFPRLAHKGNAAIRKYI